MFNRLKNLDKKTLAPLIGIGIVFVFFLLLFFRNPQNSDSSRPFLLRSLTVIPQPSPTPNPLTPITKEEEFEAIKNAQPDPADYKIDPNVLIKYETQLLTDNDKFRVTYYPKENYYWIFIKSGPFFAVKHEAEAYMRNALGLSNYEMCALNFQITVPVTVDETNAGLNHKLTGCE